MNIINGDGAIGTDIQIKVFTEPIHLIEEKVNDFIRDKNILYMNQSFAQSVGRLCIVVAYRDREPVIDDECSLCETCEHYDYVWDMPHDKEDEDMVINHICERDNLKLKDEEFENMRHCATYSERVF